MIGLILLALNLLAALFKSKSRLEAENAALRQQLVVLRRKVHRRVRLTRGDRLFLVQLYRWFPSILKVITIVRPETLVRWHRAGFRCYWSWKSRSTGGRPLIGAELRALIRRMRRENPLWGAPRIHGELLKLGFAVAQSTVAKYMARKRDDDPTGQSWAAFLRNHAPPSHSIRRCRWSGLSAPGRPMPSRAEWLRSVKGLKGPLRCCFEPQKVWGCCCRLRKTFRLAKFRECISNSALKDIMEKGGESMRVRRRPVVRGGDVALRAAGGFSGGNRADV